MKVRTKNLLLIVFVLMLIATTGITFAYWDNLNSKDSSVLEIGEGTKVLIHDVFDSDGKMLVPLGALMGINDVDKIVKEYEVELTKVSQEPLYLSVKVSNFKIGNIEYDGLVNINIIHDGIITDKEKVTLEFTMNNLDMDYSQIYNKEITFSVEFSVQSNSV